MNTSIQNESSRFMSVINQFNKDFPLFEKNIKVLMQKNNRLRFYIYILISIIFIVVSVFVIYLLKSFLFY